MTTDDILKLKNFSQSSLIFAASSMEVPSEISAQILGVGSQKVNQALKNIITLPRGILLLGTASSVHFSEGALVQATETVSNNQINKIIGPRFESLKQASCWSFQQPILSSSELKGILMERAIFDMEADSVNQWALLKNIPLVILKYITDKPDSLKSEKLLYHHWKAQLPGVRQLWLRLLKLK